MQPTFVQRLIFFALVPLVAGIVAVRQGYLSKFDELSTWKGGGMGMFASADSTDTRFLRFYIESADGKREPIVGLTDQQTVMMRRILWFPRDSVIEPLAASLRRTSFVASNEPSLVRAFSQTGEPIKALDRKHYLLHANGLRPAGQEPDWTLRMEYHRLAYDPLDRKAAFEHTKTWVFPKGGAQ